MNANRFRILNGPEANASTLPDAGDYDGDKWGRKYLVEFDDEGKAIRCVGSDGGEPEDNTFSRDWSWVPLELNKLAKEIRALRADAAAVSA